MNKKGLIHIYYGDGKGKTTAAMGLALRCAGRELPVVVAQFLKGGSSGEIDALKRFPNVRILRGMPTTKFTFQMNEAELSDTAEMCAGIFAEAVAASGASRLLVLDELIDACGAKMVNQAEVLAFLENKPDELEVIITGHSLPDWLAERADYITNMKKEKHPYDQGVTARAGIEF